MARAIFLEQGFYVEAPFTDFENALKNHPYQSLFEQSFFAEIIDTDASIKYLIEVGQSFVNILKNDGEIEVTQQFKFPEDGVYTELVRKVPFVIGSEFVDVEWVKKIHGELAILFHAEIEKFTGSVSDYMQAKNDHLHVAGRVYFHLIENKKDELPFAFMATYATGIKDKIKHVPLRNALQEFQNQGELLQLLAAVGRVANESTFISELVESGELFSPLRFDIKEAYTFLQETALYEKNGVICRIPNFWKKAVSAKVKVTVGAQEPSKVGLEELLTSQPEIYLGEDAFLKTEIEELLKQNEGLALLKGKWIEINHEKLAALLADFEKAEDLELTIFEAMRLEQKVHINEGKATLEIENGTWLKEIVKRMSQPSEIEQLEPGKTFAATLRQYQKIGYSWLKFMQENHFGALLADDMGLGKTIQILALLDALRQKNIKSLLVIPASLIENWKKETAKFAPKLKLQILHGKDVVFEKSAADLFITTYGTVAKISALTEEHFDLIILDEAQAIKNPGTKQTKSVKRIPARAKIAMTGTPVENRLSDLWSVFDFLNPGLLGTNKGFSTYTKNITDYGKLRGLIAPFILRRLKTDSTIISDLPEKIENKKYIPLSKKQIALYKGLQKEITQVLEETEGIQRKGIVLGAISKFKQICNHPDQYLGNQEFKPANSGKFEALRAICETIRDKHERVLVFTQFKEMCGPLDDFLAKIFGTRGLVLHGGTRVKKRGELVEQFNSLGTYTPYMILSLKAGGVGLNLTAANHVIHFDRWWNPAIENQATDRVFRIGQEKNVVVYKFVTSGSIEEKIDEMLEEKAQLFADVIATSSGEKWLTEMNNDELRELFTLEVE